MEETQIEKQIQERANVITEGVTGVTPQNNAISEESPLEVAKRINEENKALVAKSQEVLTRMEKIAGDLAISGKSYAGQPQKSAKEMDYEKGREIAKKYTSW